jgi:hypothetical protein
LDPTDVVDSLLRCRSASLGEHVAIRVDAHDRLEESREADREDTGSTTDLEKPSISIETQLL